MPLSTTNRTNALDRYADNRVVEPDLIRRWKEQCDSDALQTLIKNYQPMINKQIRSILAGKTISINHKDDLVQECTMTFISAVNEWEEDRGAGLATFAKRRIRNTLLTYSLDFRSAYRIGKGSDERKAYYAAQKIRASRPGASGETLTQDDIESISRSTGSSMKATKRAVDSTQARQTSIDDVQDILISADHGDAYVASSSQVKAMEEVKDFLDSISERNRDIMMRSYMSDEDPSNVELAGEFEVTPERIGQIKRKTLDLLKDHLASQGLSADMIL